MNNECGRARIVLPFHHSSFIGSRIRHADLDTTSLYEIFDDLVILRNLAPVDKRLPGLADAWQEMGLPTPAHPTQA